MRLSSAADAPFLMAIPRVFVYFAIVAWSLAFAGLVLEIRTSRAARTR